MNTCEAPVKKNLRTLRRRVNSNRRKRVIRAQFQKGEIGDYWKLNRDGSLEKDQDGWLRDENGKYILDNNGNRVGDAGIETGLLNILFGGEQGYSGNTYGSYSDEEISIAQTMMMNAGMLHTGEQNPKDRNWSGKGATGMTHGFFGLGVKEVILDDHNNGKTINAYNILAMAGDTVAAPVIFNSLDAGSNNAAFGGSLVEAIASMYIPEKAKERFANLVGAKRDFFDKSGILFAAGQTGLRSGNGFGPSDYPGHSGNQHKGFDVLGDLGTPMYSLFNGKVSDNCYTNSAGNTVIVSLGFSMDNFFYDTGIQEQFMHMNALSTLSKGSMIDNSTLIGYMGWTGDVSPKNVDGTHLHYQLMGNLGGISRDTNDARWNMYDYRRNTFLKQNGMPKTSSWTSGQTDSKNFWNTTYNNFYYNTNALRRRLGY